MLEISANGSLYDLMMSATGLRAALALFVACRHDWEVEMLETYCT